MESLKSLYEYRQMIFSLVHKELRGKYKASVLGVCLDFCESIITIGCIYVSVFNNTQG